MSIKLLHIMLNCFSDRWTMFWLHVIVMPTWPICILEKLADSIYIEIVKNIVSHFITRYDENLF